MNTHCKSLSRSTAYPRTYISAASLRFSQSSKSSGKHPTGDLPATFHVPTKILKSRDILSGQSAIASLPPSFLYISKDIIILPQFISWNASIHLHGLSRQVKQAFIIFTVSVICTHTQRTIICSLFPPYPSLCFQKLEKNRKKKEGKRPESSPKRNRSSLLRFHRNHLSNPLPALDLRFMPSMALQRDTVHAKTTKNYLHMLACRRAKSLLIISHPRLLLFRQSRTRKRKFS